MASVSPSTGAQAATQYGFEQLKLQQAKRTADQAELTAQVLRGQAVDAQREADQAQENARSLSVKSDRAQAVAGQARQGVAAIKTAGGVVQQVIHVVDQALGREAGAQTTSTTGVSSPVVNDKGQVTGKLINTTA
ncbi:MAG TPA: hypothetical protein VI279_14595 [Rhodocyclaceae bacterium]